MPIQSSGQSVSARRGDRYTEIGLLQSRSDLSFEVVMVGNPHAQQQRAPPTGTEV